jgi:predicted nucleic-acid-binding protein
VRYIGQDDPVQSARATPAIEAECSASSPGHARLIVLLEVAWVGETKGRCRGHRVAARLH